MGFFLMMWLVVNVQDLRQETKLKLAAPLEDYPTPTDPVVPESPPELVLGDLEGTISDELLLFLIERIWERVNEQQSQSNQLILVLVGCVIGFSGTVAVSLIIFAISSIRKR